MAKVNPIGRPRKSECKEKQSPPPPPPPPVSSSTGLRTGGRIKKAKVVFDPSDNYLPKKFRRESQNDSRKNDSDPSISSPETPTRVPAQKAAIKEESKKKEPEEQCSVCSKYEQKRLKLMISCLDCNDRVHPKCLKINYKDFNVLKEKYRCVECTSCVKCYEGNDDGLLITCKYCISSYHFKCHVPEVSKKSDDLNDWNCIKCSGKENITKKRSKKSINPDTTDNVSLSSESESTVQETANSKKSISPAATPAQCSAREIKLIERKPLPKPLPNSSDIQKWSTKQIYGFFESYFPEESEFIIKNEIDGQALLLLTREDVISRDSKWKLGGLLKFYNVILKIQNNTTNNTCSWS